MSGQVNAGAGQIQTLCTTIETMDRLAQVGLNEIEAIARLALLSLETPDGQRNIENVALALHAIVQKADFTCDAITYEADEVGRGYKDDSRMRRVAARSAVLSELDQGRAGAGQGVSA